MENDANRANVEELRAHIDRTSAKLAGSGTEHHTENVALLEDYYERLLQIRSMSMDTCKQSMVEAAEHSRRVRRVLLGALVVLLGVVLYLLEAQTPGITLLCAIEVQTRMDQFHTITVIGVTAYATATITRMYSG